MKTIIAIILLGMTFSANAKNENGGDYLTYDENYSYCWRYIDTPAIKKWDTSTDAFEALLERDFGCNDWTSGQVGISYCKSDESFDEDIQVREDYLNYLIGRWCSN